ncbi:MAG: DUF350 domain-containing protein [Bacillota bacterium]
MSFTDNLYLNTVIWWAVFFTLMIIAIKVFNLVTPFRIKQETREKNGALGAILAGMMIGVSIIFFASITASETMGHALINSALGYGLMLVSYFLFNWITPENISKEIDDHNLLVGYKIAGLFIAVGLVVAAAIS